MRNFNRKQLGILFLEYVSRAHVYACVGGVGGCGREGDRADRQLWFVDDVSKTVLNILHKEAVPFGH